MTVLVVRREVLANRTPEVVPSQVLTDSLWQIISNNRSQQEASSKTRVSIVEFYDYACPFCRQLNPVLDSIQAKYSPEVAVIYRHLPRAKHDWAYIAAIAAECAANQGYFSIYHNTLFANQVELSSFSSWDSLAQVAGIPDLARFSDCVVEARPRSKVSADSILGRRLQITAIPTLVVNGSMYEGTMTFNQLNTIVRRARRNAD